MDGAFAMSYSASRGHGRAVIWSRANGIAQGTWILSTRRRLLGAPSLSGIKQPTLPGGTIVVDLDGSDDYGIEGSDEWSNR